MSPSAEILQRLPFLKKKKKNLTSALTSGAPPSLAPTLSPHLLFSSHFVKGTPSAQSPLHGFCKCCSLCWNSFPLFFRYQLYVSSRFCLNVLLGTLSNNTHPVLCCYSLEGTPPPSNLQTGIWQFLQIYRGRFQATNMHRRARIWEGRSAGGWPAVLPPSSQLQGPPSPPCRVLLPPSPGLCAPAGTCGVTAFGLPCPIQHAPLAPQLDSEPPEGGGSHLVPRLPWPALPRLAGDRCTRLWRGLCKGCQEAGLPRPAP